MPDSNKPKSGITIRNSHISGCETAIHIEDPENTSLEADNLEIKGCRKGITTGIANRLRPLVVAIKKPLANGSGGWSPTIVGVILAAFLSLIVGIILLNYEWHHEEATQLENSQPQKQESKK